MHAGRLQGCENVIHTEAEQALKVGSAAGEPSPAEKEVADVAVDLFRSPRSKGGFGEIADWADFPEPSVRFLLMVIQTPREQPSS